LEDKVIEIDFSKAEHLSSVEYIPRIPVNDFSYLKDIGLIPELELQKEITLNSSDFRRHYSTSCSNVYYGRNSTYL